VILEEAKRDLETISGRVEASLPLTREKDGGKEYGKVPATPMEFRKVRHPSPARFVIRNFSRDARDKSASGGFAQSMRRSQAAATRHWTSG